MLVLNVCIVVVGVAVVWDKLRERSGLGEQEIPVLESATVPIPPRDGAPRDAGGARVPMGNSSHGSRSDTEPAAGAVVGERATETTGAGATVGSAVPATHSPEPASQLPSADPATRLRGQVDAVPAPTATREQTVAASVHPLAATEAVIDRIGVDIEVLHTIRGAYPSSAAAYGANRGIEALHVALAKIGKTATLRLGDTDDDGRMEILDAWGRPLVYFSPDDYSTKQSWVPGDREAVELGACRVVGSQAFHASASYQLFSVGPDGLMGGGRQDDITSWVRKD